MRPRFNFVDHSPITHHASRLTPHSPQTVAVSRRVVQSDRKEPNWAAEDKDGPDWTGARRRRGEGRGAESEMNGHGPITGRLGGQEICHQSRKRPPWLGRDGRASTASATARTRNQATLRYLISTAAAPRPPRLHLPPPPPYPVVEGGSEGGTARRRRQRESVLSRFSLPGQRLLDVVDLGCKRTADAPRAWSGPPGIRLGPRAKEDDDGEEEEEDSPHLGHAITCHAMP
ncbi:MAG: hypothetical protein M1837_005742 [Sclerophora amabilis]|nr:MAG: hypothetical protein M1837_005742 [Sclerophora amabilis]